MTDKHGYITLTARQNRENELNALLSNTAGRNQLAQLLRQCLNIPKGQLPLGMPFVQTILAHEFSNSEASSSG
jgi:hypothetical protein